MRFSSDRIGHRPYVEDGQGLVQGNVLIESLVDAAPFPFYIQIIIADVAVGVLTVP